MIQIKKIRRRLDSIKLKVFLNPHSLWLFCTCLLSNKSLAKKQFFIIGGGSDIAKEFTPLLKSKNIYYIGTSRSINDTQAKNTAVYLDYENIDSFHQAITCIDTESLTDIVFFTGYFDFSSDASIDSLCNFYSAFNAENVTHSFDSDMKINAFGPFIFANMLGSYLREKNVVLLHFICASSIGSSVHDVFPGMYFLGHLFFFIIC